MLRQPGEIGPVSGPPLRTSFYGGKGLSREGPDSNPRGRTHRLNGNLSRLGHEHVGLTGCHRFYGEGGLATADGVVSVILFRGTDDPSLWALLELIALLMLGSIDGTSTQERRLVDKITRRYGIGSRLSREQRLNVDTSLGPLGGVSLPLL